LRFRDWALGGKCSLALGRVLTPLRTHEFLLAPTPDTRVPEESGALRGTADMYVGMSELEREYNNLPAATQHLLSSQAQGEHTGFPQNRYRWRVAMARIRRPREIWTARWASWSRPSAYM
jgi:LuxR family transcriptional regulator, maltose regulon positive regulatory protein